ncbi:MAG: 4-hydroxy-tetrahydrodipicolinate synthase [Bacteroidales bacterium]|nr:4-hydroxy-tetrahydrodipicolinate synthase [Bacteroidales bacterium]
MPQQKFKGTGVAIVTPFREDGTIDFRSLGKLIEHIIAKGVEYVVALGTTGENVTLSKDEKKAVVNHVVDVVGRRVPVVVGMGGNNTQEVINGIKGADFDGVDAILSVAPYYNKPSQKGLYLHFKTIADVSPVPVIIYNVPGRTGSNISADTTVRLAKENKNIVAIKEASNDLCQIMNIIKNKPKNFLVISGDDANTLPIIALGGSGVISVVANAYPKEFSDMVRLALQCDIQAAAEIHYKLLDMIWALFAEGSPSGIKAVLEVFGLVKNHVRLPLVPVSDEHYKKLTALVKKLQ